MSRELDAEVARVLGWRDVRLAPSYHNSNISYEDNWFGKPPGCTYDALIPYYTATRTLDSEDDWAHESLATVRELEGEIGRRGLWWKYLNILHEVVNQARFDGHGSLWYITTDEIARLIRATPEQKCRAFLKAVEDA